MGTWSALQALIQALNAGSPPHHDTLLQALQRLRRSIQDMTRTLGQMHGTMGQLVHQMALLHRLRDRRAQVPLIL